jgi:hypothetical protein
MVDPPRWEHASSHDRGGSGRRKDGVYRTDTAIGVDGATIKPGLALILDPCGEVLVESPELEDDVVVGLLTAEALAQASGRRYLRALRPGLYGKLVEAPAPGQEPVTLPGWERAFDRKATSP